jgi:ABC-2 type transport system permease protein
MCSSASLKEKAMTADNPPRIGNSRMVLKTGSGWSRGLENVLGGELKQWFNTRSWWVQILIWAASINFIFLMVALSARQEPDIESMMIFNIFFGLAGPIGVSIVMQGAIVGEKNSGTAAWVLSKPVSRTAFILAKLLGNAIGLAVTMILAQGLIGYLIAGLVVGSWLPAGGFLAAMGVHFVHILFYMTLTLLMGVLFNHPAPVIGIPLAFLFTQNFIGGLHPSFSKVLPWNLAVPPNNSTDLPLAGALMTGQPVGTVLPLYSTLAASILFVVIALWVFNRQEL